MTLKNEERNKDLFESNTVGTMQKAVVIAVD